MGAAMLRTPALLLLLSAPALATATFPTVIQQHLSLARSPAQSCMLCHTNGITGPGTVNTPMGKALSSQGLLGNDEQSLRSALDALATAGTDSDGDGVGDVAELKAGTDPNVGAPSDGGTGGGAGGGAGGGGGGAGGPPPPRFGCGASVAPGLLAGATLALLLRRRRPARR